MATRRLIVIGRVQGVGYRQWAVREAARLGLSGWVRNLHGGEVELLLDGETDAVDEMLRACRRGPRGASVSEINEEVAEPPDHEGFEVRPSVTG